LTSLEDLKVTLTAITEDGAAALKKKLGDSAKIQLMYIEGVSSLFVFNQLGTRKHNPLPIGRPLCAEILSIDWLAED